MTLIAASVTDLSPIEDIQIVGQLTGRKRSKKSDPGEVLGRVQRLAQRIESLMDRLVVPLTRGRVQAADGLLQFFEGRLYIGIYVGRVVDEEIGIDLTIEPRMAREALALMLGSILNVKVTPAAARLMSTEAPLLLLLFGLLWRDAVLRGLQHGPPTRRRERSWVGRAIRGTLDVAGTVSLRARGRTGSVASVDRPREIERLPLQIIDAAGRSLRAQLGSQASSVLVDAESALAEWTPSLASAPRLSARDLLRATVRYSPISELLRPAVEMSRKILQGSGMGMQPASGARTWGSLIDMAEVWELYTFRRLRAENPHLDVEHAARSPMEGLLVDEDGQPAELMAPDVVGRDRRTRRAVFVADAKYKRRAMLREDLFQILAYQTRLGAQEAWLVYPDAIAECPLPARDFRRAERVGMHVRTRMLEVSKL